MARMIVILPDGLSDWVETQAALKTAKTPEIMSRRSSSANMKGN